MTRRITASVSLTTVLVTSTILLLVGITFILQAIDLSNASKNSVNYELNLMRSRSCVEEGLNRLKYNQSFTGSASIPYSDGSCTVEVTNDPGGNPNLKVLSISSNVSGYYYTATKIADVSVNPFTVTNP